MVCAELYNKNRNIWDRSPPLNYNKIFTFIQANLPSHVPAPSDRKNTLGRE